jgi:hypothetical protein
MAESDEYPHTANSKLDFRGHVSDVNWSQPLRKFVQNKISREKWVAKATHVKYAEPERNHDKLQRRLR